MEAMKSDGSFQDGCVPEIVHGDAFTAFKIPYTEYTVYDETGACRI